jgi:hypothetical protein
MKYCSKRLIPHRFNILWNIILDRSNVVIVIARFNRSRISACNRLVHLDLLILLTLENTAGNMCTTDLNNRTHVFSPHSEFMCFI